MEEKCTVNGCSLTGRYFIADILIEDTCVYMQWKVVWDKDRKVREGLEMSLYSTAGVQNLVIHSCIKYPTMYVQKQLLCKTL